MPPLYRLFIDESGTHDLKNCDLPRNRYLCLLGLIVSEEDQPDLESRLHQLKKRLP
jgi:hypothetical protein